MPAPKRSVLLVEDDVDTAVAVGEILHELGYRVATAGDGVDALALLRSEGVGDIGLVVVDGQMPRMSGKQLIAALRDDPQFCALPIVMMTGLTPPFHAAVRVDGVPLLSKPVDVDALVAVVRETCG
jgi:CheY-like chemotaxis protein